MELPKTYDAKEVEDKIYQKWEASGFFNPDNLEKASDRYWKAKPFSIAMPPPNATGELHMGHALMLALEDLMIRHARMRGGKTLWLPGTDHAAIATNYVVEKQLWQAEKKTRQDLGREEFPRRVEKFVETSRGRIQHQIRKMGASCDWSREKYTLSPELSFAVRAIFKKMYDRGLIYRGDRIVNWCIRCGTTLADDEVEYRKSTGKIYYIRYPFPKEKGGITVATVRPETMLADTAVAVHPQDPRYKKYQGKTVMLPLVNRELPIIADDFVDKDFGTGALKVTPGHDPHDFEIGIRNNLPIINLLTLAGKVDRQAALDYGFEIYADLSVEDARKKIIQDLNTGGFLEKIDDLEHNLSVCYRCNLPVEPLVSKQWFVGVNQKIQIQNQDFRETLGLPEKASLKEIGYAAIKSEAIKIVPDHFKKTYLHWMENLHDWNISRQIWFGHQIPVWYCGADKTTKAQKIMGFHESVAPQVITGKTKTYRLRDHNFSVGETIAFQNSQTGELFGSGLITNIEKISVGKIDLQDPAHGATYENRDQLIKRFRLHYPDKKIQASTPAFIYTYKFSPQEQPPNSGCGEIIVALEKPSACPSCEGTNFYQDPDTLDTWFSSSLWTFSTLGWPEETQDLKTFHPTTVLETGYDILFFWVARMVLMTGFALEDIPFRTVYLHGLIRDVEGKKMSKSKGNVINPLEIIDHYGADALRLALILGTTPGNDAKISETKIQSFRNFVNKLWNIARFILPKSAEQPAKLAESAPRDLVDEWILEELEQLIASVNSNLDKSQFSLAGEALYDFTWNKFADWYIEISKVKSQKSKVTEEILFYVLQNLLRLWHPFIPFVTEEIWGSLSKELLMTQEYPIDISKLHKDLPQGVKSQKSKVRESFAMLQSLIIGIRNLRSEYRQPPKEILACYLDLRSQQGWLENHLSIIEKLTRVKMNLMPIPDKKTMPNFLWQGTKAFLVIPHFDPKKEKKLAEKELELLKNRLQKLESQFANKAFLDKAPPEIISKLKESLSSAKIRQEQLVEKIRSL